MPFEVISKVVGCSSEYYNSLENKSEDKESLYLVNSGSFINGDVFPYTNVFYRGQSVKNVSLLNELPSDINPSQKIYLVKEDSVCKFYFKYNDQLLSPASFNIKEVRQEGTTTDILFETDEVSRLLCVSEGLLLPVEFVDSLLNEYDVVNESKLSWKSILPRLVVIRFDQPDSSWFSIEVEQGEILKVVVRDLEGQLVSEESFQGSVTKRFDIKIPCFIEVEGSEVVLKKLTIEGSSVSGLIVESSTLEEITVSSYSLRDIRIKEVSESLRKISLGSSILSRDSNRLLTIVRTLPDRSSKEKGTLQISDCDFSEVSSEMKEKNWESL